MTGADSFFSIIKGGSDSVTNPRIPRGFPPKIGVTGPKFGSQTQAKWSHASQILEFDEASSQICGARGVHQGFTGGHCLATIGDVMAISLRLQSDLMVPQISIKYWYRGNVATPWRLIVTYGTNSCKTRL